MKTFRSAVLAVVVGVLGASGAAAQIKNQQPAEFPPSSYKGKQYVDSKGCVFIRAGIDGDVSWIPRVTRDRKTICGFAPTAAGQTSVVEVQAPAQQVEQITIEPAPAPTTVATATPAPKPRPAATRKVVRQVAPKPKPVRVAKAPAAVVPRATAQQLATACPNASSIGQQYLRKSGKIVVRCGPQQAPIGTRKATVASTQVAAVDPNTPISVSPQRRIVPRHVALNRINTTNVQIPHGYKAAWQDGRLNPKRAEQTLAGRSEMLLVWTNTVPRRLIDRSSGKDVTSSTPLVYPYIDADLQSRELGQVSIVRRNGKVVKRIVRHRQPVISTRSAPKAKAPVTTARVKAQAVGKARFVQIGYFTTKAKAQKAAQNLSGLGLQAQIGKVRKGGKTYLSVRAGPFKSPNATQRALSRVHGFGYTGAVARN